MLRGAAQMPGQGRERYNTRSAAVEPARGFAPFVGNFDPLAERINAIAEDYAWDLGIERKHVLVMLHSAVTPSRRWMA